MPHLLVVDDDADVVGWISEVAREQGFTVAPATSLRDARAQMSLVAPDVIVSDLQLPDGRGIDLINDIERREATAFVLVTGHASLESAIDALRLGATDYLIKPVDPERLEAVLSRVPRREDLHEKIGELRDELRKLGRFGSILGSSPAMQKLYDQLARVAPTSATVLLVGESGTGKELAAQTIHELSRRSKRPFLAVNCGAISPHLIESELFGHEKGSFTGAERQHQGFFERAHGGTLFLDEISEMNAELQIKLLRVLETGQFMRVGTNTPISADVRVIAATNRRPEAALADGRLREDLYHRLNVFPINLPPLRERGTDIELLAQHFLDTLNRQERARKVLSDDAVAALYSHHWPGNVRELKNRIQRAYILADKVIEPAAPAPTPPENGASASRDAGDLLTVRVGTSLEEVDRRVIEATLAGCGNAKRKAADVLGISLKTLYNKLAAYGATVGEAKRDTAKHGPVNNGGARRNTTSEAAKRRPRTISKTVPPGPPGRGARPRTRS
jgi:two-component system response regulator AtoC